MSKEKQMIDLEMAETLEIIEKAREEYANDITDHTENEYIREGLLNKGYRKQSVGEWEQHGLSNPKCSLCHSYNVEKSRFCPNCGAKMKGGKE